MAKIKNKISVYGDSISTSQQGAPTRAAKLNRGAGFNDYAVGGQTMKDTLLGKTTHNGAPMWGGKTFAQQMLVDDCDICVIALGGNDAPYFRGTYGLMPATAVPADYLGAEYLDCAANIRMLHQAAQAAGKRVVVIGMPYMNVQRVVDTGLLPNIECAKGYATRYSTMQTVHRVACGFAQLPFISTYGGTPAEMSVQPVPNYASTVDGLHPTAAYATAVNDYLKGQLQIIYPA